MKLWINILLVMVIFWNDLALAQDNRLNTTLIDRIPVTNLCEAVLAEENYLYFFDSFEYFLIYDITNPLIPQPITRWRRFGEFMSKMIKRGNYIYSNRSSTGIEIIDVSDQIRPRLVGEWEANPHLAQDVSGMFVQGNYLYVATNMDGLRILDIENRQNPTPVGHFFGPEWGETRTSSVFIKDTIAFVTDVEFGLWILNVVDPSDPVEIANYELGDRGIDIVLREGIAYVADYRDGVRILDVSNYEDIQELSVIETPVRAVDLSLEENYLYVHVRVDNDSGGVRIIDVTDPANPNEVGYYLSREQTINISAQDGYVYMSAYEAGLFIIRNDLYPHPPSSFNLLRPTDGSRLANSVVPFSWQESIDPNAADTVFYHLFLKDGRDTASFVFTNTIAIIDLDSVFVNLNERVTDILWWVVGVSGEDTVRSEESFWLFLFPNDVTDDNLSALTNELTLDCSPNPFNGITKISYYLNKRQFITLEIYNLQGGLIEKLYEGHVVQGKYSQVWDATSYSSGVYFAVVRSSVAVVTQEMLLVK